MAAAQGMTVSQAPWLDNAASPKYSLRKKKKKWKGHREGLVDGRSLLQPLARCSGLRLALRAYVVMALCGYGPM